VSERPPALTHALERLQGLRVAHAVAGAAVVIALGYTGWLGWFVITHSSFQEGGDDVVGFWMSKHLRFWSYLFTPCNPLREVR
jgi:hypothetical protein